MKIVKTSFKDTRSNKLPFDILYEDKDFIGKSWCNEASFLDFFQYDVRYYWKNLIKSKQKQMNEIYTFGSGVSNENFKEVCWKVVIILLHRLENEAK